ncbi:membrane protein [Lentzea sp. NBRC 105346]|uniref:FtsX-like permease family protein n=1 Tax=Lentzea sp. NBRC 105346 TaxID=3032205 RepID=UPI0024A4C544|nr:FtsX-like permease family protein [Lentzea sp. NBRC 105346]GLZ36257.1 membrane protein [Lentzea sp. NBRC 105346]
MIRWADDLLLGVRLAVGGGRNSWIRLVLTGLGIGLGVAVLLVAASFPTALNARDHRADQLRVMDDGPAIAGVDPLYRVQAIVDFRDKNIWGSYLDAAGPNAPVPPGADRIPGDGEILVSPALGRLLASPEGELLRPRFPERIVGEIGRAGLEGPYELRFYAGNAQVEHTAENRVYRFGLTRAQVYNPLLYAISVVFVVILLFPVLVFVGISTRLSGAQRDRRLAALRLIGASAQRVRLIAAGEALLGAFVGLAVGFALFFFGRQYTEDVRLADAALFREDLTPAPALVVLLVIFVPVLAVVTAVVAMRRTVIEPLGVVREARPVRRSLWWRLVPIIGGIALLVSQVGTVSGPRRPNEYVLASGVSLLMLGIPLVLPWLVERSVGRLHRGSVAWQLAVRRLQLDSGSAARVVGGVAVVLAGAIALQTILASAERSIASEDHADAGKNHLVVSSSADADVSGLAAAKGVREVLRARQVSAQTESENWIAIVIADCPALRGLLRIDSCHEGSVFRTRDADIEAEGSITFVEYQDDRSKRVGATWRLPAAERVSSEDVLSGELYVTPSVLRNVPTPKGQSYYVAALDPAVPDAVEHARNAVGPLRWRAFSYFAGQRASTEAAQVFASMRKALLAGALLVLVLVGASLLVMAVEQIRERRRPLAVLVASGVPRRVLVWSVLWQNAFPLLLAMIVAVATGAGLGALLLRVLAQPVALDWLGVITLTGVTAAAVFVVTLLTLPSLRTATAAPGLRTE